MRVFTVEGRFMATDIDDALEFLARYFVNVGCDPSFDRASIIRVDPEDEQATKRAEAS